MEGAEIAISLPDHTSIPGRLPLVLIGANGTGKTRLGAQMAVQFNYDRIPAHRDGALGDSNAMQTLEAASATRRNYANYKFDPQGRAPDLVFIYNELLAEQLSEQIAYAQRGKTDASQGLLAVSRLEKVAQLWGVLFPGRDLSLDYFPKVKWNNSDTEYPPRLMSDGEQSGLYLVLRVFVADAGVLIIDEPELHMHPLLARKFWDMAEELRPDCRFVYLAHDLGFAISRRGTIGVVLNEAKVQIVEHIDEISPDIIDGILGSAALSVVAKRVIFREGEARKSLDVRFYAAWFNHKDTAVIPVKNCDAVRRTFKAFSEGAFIKNGTALGIVERDYWPDAFLDRLNNEGLFVLATHELEGLLCLPKVFIAVADYLGFDDTQGLYKEFFEDAKANFRGIRLQKLIIERAKHDVELLVTGFLNSAHASENPDETRSAFVTKVDLSNTVPNPGEIFDKHKNIVGDAIAGDALGLLRIVPSKDVIGRLLAHLDLKTIDAYMRIIVDALMEPQSGRKPHLQDLQNKLVDALSPYLPPRSV